MKIDQGKEAGHIAQFHLSEVFRIGKSKDRKQISGFQRLGRRERTA